MDLAGSERVTLSGAEGDRLREANHINKSLSVLGDVINRLADNKGGHVPYRNSVLTQVLRDSLGGNAHAVMIATVSPSSSDYEETLSTLKYADRATRVRMKVRANITSGILAANSSMNELVPILQAEVNKLRELLHQQELSNSARAIIHTMSENVDQRLEDSEESGVKSVEIVREMQERVVELERQLEDRERLIASLKSRSHVSDVSHLDPTPSIASDQSTHVQLQVTHDWMALPLDTIRSMKVPETRPGRASVVLADDAVDISVPRLTNLNQDPLFSECLVYYLHLGTVIAGSNEADEEVDILLSGPDIQRRHCELVNTNGSASIIVDENALVFVNGRRLNSGRTTLRHLDRIAFGRFHLFRFEASGQMATRTTDSSVFVPDWEFAQQELMAKVGSPTYAGGGPSPLQRQSTPLASPLSIIGISPSRVSVDESSSSVDQMLLTPAALFEGSFATTRDESEPNKTTFEKEAIALQEELAQMQRALQERIQRYQSLTLVKP